MASRDFRLQVLILCLHISVHRITNKNKLKKKKTIWLDCNQFSQLELTTGLALGAKEK